MCRFYLKQAHPRFQLYVSPINIDPADPALPISTPSGYSRFLSEEVGEFYTQGIAEDTKALSDGVLDDKEFLEQSRTVLAEHRRIFDLQFPKFQIKNASMLGQYGSRLLQKFLVIQHAIRKSFRVLRNSLRVELSYFF